MIFICLSFPRATHWPDAPPTWQLHSSEEQQPACDYCGHRWRHHSAGGGDRGRDLHPAFFSPAEKVGTASSQEMRSHCLT